jgi:hypothetical protein
LVPLLTAHGLSDSQIRLISGHSSKKSLEIYQHLSLESVQKAYQDVVDTSACDLFIGMATPNGKTSYAKLAENTWTALRDSVFRKIGPYLHIHAGQLTPRIGSERLAENVIQTLNVAGPRESKEPSVAKFVVETLDRVFGTSDRAQGLRLWKIPRYSPPQNCNFDEKLKFISVARNSHRTHAKVVSKTQQPNNDYGLGN